MGSERRLDLGPAAKLGNLISKDYAEDILRLLVNYKDISASEAASRLNLHVRTAQEFLEGMASLGILEQKEVVEKKRPYFRYSLKTDRISMEIDLTSLAGGKDAEGHLSWRIRENKKSGARFTTARYDSHFSNVVVWIGEGRDRTERKINLTAAQGKFLFRLPFPTAEPQAIGRIMRQAGLGEDLEPEILDIVERLAEFRVLDVYKK